MANDLAKTADWFVKSLEEAEGCQAKPKQPMAMTQEQHKVLASRIQNLHIEMNEIANSVRDAYKKSQPTQRIWADIRKAENALYALRTHLDDRAWLEHKSQCYGYYRDIISGSSPRLPDEFVELPPKTRALRLFLHNLSQIIRPCHAVGQRAFFVMPIPGKGLSISKIDISPYSGDFSGSGVCVPRITIRNYMKCPATIEAEWREALSVNHWVKSEGELEITCTIEELPDFADYTVAMHRALIVKSPKLPHCRVPQGVTQTVSNYTWTLAATEQYNALTAIQKR